MASNERISIGEAEFTLKQLAECLVRAKRHCYAGNGREKILADGSKQLTAQEGPFHYTDNYAGYFQAPGTEIVRWRKGDGQRIWQMSYSGGMLPRFHHNLDLAKKTFDFLKEALAEVKPSAPFRGLEWANEETRKWCTSFTGDGGFSYFADTQGDIRSFKGKEEIHKLAYGIVFEQDYIGGLIIPKL